MDSEFKLAIYPVNPDYHVNRDKLESLLKKIALLGASLSPTHYAVGENFLSLLTFMGCSPNIELEPQDDKPYCTIEIETHEQAQFISGKNTKFPPCPHCKSKLDKLIDNPTCSNCNTPIKLEKLNWRKSAFVASSWIVIGNIYELEAIPNDQLLNALESVTGGKWKYAYIRQAIN